MSFNILFYGLVCHRTEEDTSVFIGAHGHELRMVVRHRDVISKAGFAADPDETHFALETNEPQTSFIIKGRVLQVEGTTKPQGGSTFTSQFQTFVPRLRQNSECAEPNVNPAVIDRKTDDVITAFLQHDGGEFSVNDFFPEKCTFTGDVKDAQCIARTTQLALEASQNVTITDGNGGRIVLRPDAEVRFVNTVPPPFGAMLNNRHFGMYYGAIFQGCSGRTPMEAQIACGHRHDPSFAVGGGDCSSSGDP